MFYVGQKVVCVNGNFIDRDKHFYPDDVLPVTGGVYTVRELFSRHRKPGMRLIEIRNPLHNHCGCLMECGFHRSRFRPLIERKTDISIFTRMLTPNKATEPA